MFQQVIVQAVGNRQEIENHDVRGKIYTLYLETFQSFIVLVF